MTTTALDKQVDGTHYTDQAIQPLELCYTLGGSPCFCKLVKYLTRQKGDKLINLRKALHVIELEEALVGTRIYSSTMLSLSYPQAQILFTKVTRNHMAVDAMYGMFTGEFKHAKLAVEELIAQEENSRKGK